ncbi:hypothetical protein RHECNPAF_3500055 [Rhizobium etli CNPAF512]|nr:hypothetical protein RHECNPAF_3500055 [Rhizobium etli CNPAF512]
MQGRRRWKNVTAAPEPGRKRKRRAPASAPRGSSQRSHV